MSRDYFEAPADESTRIPLRELVGACMERDTSRLLLDHGALPPEFFDLSSGLAGELVQKLVSYGIRMAAVVPDLTVHSSAFQEFAREAGRVDQFRFIANRQRAEEWLALASARTK